MSGYVYLLHFTRPIHPDRPAQHYLGFADSLASRLAAHRAGGDEAARICQVAVERGIGIYLVRAWEGSRADERRLKSWRNGPQLCPWCNASPRNPDLVEVTPSLEGWLVDQVEAALTAVEKNRRRLLRYHNARTEFFEAGSRLTFYREWLDNLRGGGRTWI